MTDEILALAADIAVDGFQWQSDGWKAFKIIQLLDRGLDGADQEHRHEYLVAGLKVLDRQFGWDLAGRSQAQEDTLYGFFVQLYLG